MDWDKLIDQKIREAMARGEFDNLPGAGKPQDHSAYFALPEDVRMGYTVLKNSGYLPEEAQLLKEIAGLEARLEGATAETERRPLIRAIRDRRLAFDVLMELKKRRRPARRV